MFSSKAFRLKVTRHPRRIIQLKPGERKQAEALIAALDARQKLKVVRGSYDKSVHEFLSPKSPPGRLLTMGWQAAPVLLETLADRKTSLRKRAWVLSLLSTISGEEEFDPLGDSVSLHASVLPDYDRSDDSQDDDGVLGSIENIRGGGACAKVFAEIVKQLRNQPIDRKAQQEFIDRWLRFRRDYLDIREAPRRKKAFDHLSTGSNGLSQGSPSEKSPVEPLDVGESIAVAKDCVGGSGEGLECLVVRLSKQATQKADPRVDLQQPVMR